MTGRVLVVDDEASIRRILETRLSMIGYDVVTAADGEEPLDTFRGSLPDLVVLDALNPKLPTPAVRAWGYFGPEWTVEPGEIAWRASAP